MSEVKSVVDELAAWKATAVQACHDCDYYKTLLDQIAERIGLDAYICDDGSKSEEPLRAKLPELVRGIVRCGTCEWWSGGDDAQCMHPGKAGTPMEAANADGWCSNWGSVGD